MSEIVAFKYGDLDADTSGFIHEAAGRIRVRLARSSQDIVEIGLDLTMVKDRLPHGKFGRWIDTEFEMTPRMAQHFMAVAEKFSSKNEMISYLSPTALYALTAADADTVAEAEQMSQNGETVTTAVVKELRAKNKKLREERDVAKTEKEGGEAFVTDAANKLHEATCEVQYLTKEIERITSENTVDAKITYDDAPLRQALMAFWNQLPPETQEWFLGEVSE